jgi:hypothetical protein
MLEPRKLVCAGLLIVLIMLIQHYQIVIIIPQNKLIFSFIVGAIGSAAYITVLGLRLIGSDEDEGEQNPFMARFSFPRKPDYYKCTWYVLMGGAIATVFQVDVDQFVAVQSLILGATWPAVISQFLSGRMTTLGQRERRKVDEEINSKISAVTGRKNKRQGLVDKISKMEDTLK